MDWLKSSARSMVSEKMTKWLLVLGAICLFALAFVIAQGQAWMVDRDFFTYWAGGRGVLESVNIYSEPVWRALHERNGAEWFPNPIFIYAPPTALWFAPLAALPVSFASVLWVWFSALAVAASVILLLRELQWADAPRVALGWSLAFVFFLPTLLTLLMGQASAMILLCVVVTGILWERGHWFWGGMVLTLALVKPQPIIFLFLTIAAWLIYLRRWRALAGGGVGTLALGLGGLFLFPNFLSDWLAVALNKVGGVSGRMPTLWGLAHEIEKGAGTEFVFASVLVCVVLVLNLALVWRMRARRALEVLAVCTIFAVALTPYLWTYDLLLLIFPFVIACVKLARSSFSFRLIALAPLGLMLLSFLMFAVAAMRLSDTAALLLTLGCGGWLGMAFAQEDARRTASSLGI